MRQLWSYGTFMMKSLCSANKIVNFVSRHAAFYRIMLSPFGRNAHHCLVYFDVSWLYIFSVELKKIAWSSYYYLSLTSDKMSAVNLLSELLDVRARRLEISGYNTNEIDCLISSICSD